MCNTPQLFIKIKINEIEINEILKENELIQYAEELTEFEINLKHKIKSPLFFDDFKFHQSFLPIKIENYRYDFSEIFDVILNEFHMASPIEVLGMLLYTQYISYKRSNDIIDLWIGDASVSWLQIQFINGIVTNTVAKIEDGVDEPTDAFFCNVEEMNEFFSVPISKRLRKQKAVKLKDLIVQMRNESSYNAKELFSKQSLEVRSDKNLVIECLAINIHILDHVAKELLDDENVIAEAFKQDSYYSLKFASDRIKSNRKFVTDVLKSSGRALEFVKEKFGNDKDMVLAAVNNYGDALAYASNALKNDKEIVLAAVSNVGGALEYASDDLKNDKEIALAAIETHHKAFKYIGRKLKENRDFVEKAFLINPKVFEYISHKVEGYEKIAKKAVELNFEHYEILPNYIKLDEDLTEKVLEKLKVNFNLDRNLRIAIDIAKSLRYFQNHKLVNFLDFLIGELKVEKNNRMGGEIYFFRAELFQQKKDDKNYLKYIKKAISELKKEHKNSLKNCSIGWAFDEIFVESLENFAEYELTKNLAEKSLIISNTELQNLISEPLCLTSRFIGKCKSEKLKSELRKIKENQSKAEIIEQIEKVKKIDWYSSVPDLLQFPIVGMNKELFKDEEVKNLSFAICPFSRYFFLDSDIEQINFATKNPFIYPYLTHNQKSNFNIILSLLNHPYHDHIKYIPYEAFEDRKNVLQMCTVNGRVYTYLSNEKYLFDEEIILKAVENFPDIIESIPSSLLDEERFIEQLLIKNGEVILGINSKFLSDKKLVLLAIKNWKDVFYPAIFKKLAINFMDDIDVIIAACKHTSGLVEKLELKEEDREVIIKALKK